MAERLKWEFEEETAVADIYEYTVSDRAGILELLGRDSLAAHFQPIFSIKEEKPFGYEALARIKGTSIFSNIGELFIKAKEAEVIRPLDMKCRENAFKEAADRGFNEINANLFVNICPESLMDPAHYDGLTDTLAEEHGISKDRIILEITEETAIHNYALFMKAITYYKKAGYKIAIDDFGAGYGGLKMLSLIEPDFVKIDRHFISNIDKALMKFNLVDAITTACHRMGIKVIAEGIEQKEEFEIMSSMGIDLFQGFYFGRPAQDFNYEPLPLEIRPGALLKFRKRSTCSEAHFIGSIVIEAETVARDSHIKSILNMFLNNKMLRNVPVVDAGRVIGMLHRIRFIENQVIGKCGYGVHLNSFKNVDNLMETNFLMVEADTTIEEVSIRIKDRAAETLYDDICVTQNGKYLGLVTVSELLEAITQKSIKLARGSNPLTGLPGNEAIQREIEKQIIQNMHFDICYLDLNNFKPYNDHYGFERGDLVIKELAQILQKVLEASASVNFIGHIGGDDFIMITHPSVSIQASEKVVSAFENKLADFHGTEDYSYGFYNEKSRKDELETFPLLSISIGILSTEVHTLTSYAQAASLSTEIKKLAKKEAAARCGGAIVRDMRLMGDLKP